MVDPGPGGAPSIEVYDLIDGAYQVRTRARGDETITVDAPVPVTLSPAQLIDR